MIENNSVNIILRKRLNTYRSPKGSLTGLPDDLILDVIRAWETWSGTSKSFYSGLGIKKEQLSSIIKKGKRLSKEGKDRIGQFVPMEINDQNHHISDENGNAPIILKLDNSRSIQFFQVGHLIEFLKSAA